MVRPEFIGQPFPSSRRFRLAQTFAENQIEYTFGHVYPIVFHAISADLCKVNRTVVIMNIQLMEMMRNPEKYIE